MHSLLANISVVDLFMGMKFSQQSDIGLAQLVQRLHASYIVVGDVLLSEEERKLSSMQSFSAMSVCI